jgi:hypothetical protein
MPKALWFYLARDQWAVWREEGGELQPVPVGAHPTLPLYFSVRGATVEVGAMCEKRYAQGVPGVEGRVLERAGDPTQLVRVGDRPRPVATLLATALEVVRAASEEPVDEVTLVWGVGVGAAAQEALLRVLQAGGVRVVRQIRETEALCLCLVNRGDITQPTLVLDAAFGHLYATVVSPPPAGTAPLAFPETRVLSGYGVPADRGAVASLLVERAAAAKNHYLIAEQRAAELAALLRAPVVDAVLAAAGAEWAGEVQLSMLGAPVFVRLARREVEAALAPRLGELRRFVEGLVRREPVQEVLLLEEALASAVVVETLEPVVGIGKVRPFRGPREARLREGAFRRAYPAKVPRGVQTGKRPVDPPSAPLDQYTAGMRAEATVRSIGATCVVLVDAAGVELVLPLGAVAAALQARLAVGAGLLVILTARGDDGRWEVAVPATPRESAGGSAPSAAASMYASALPTPKAGANLHTTVRLPFRVAALGGTYEFHPDVRVLCLRCQGDSAERTVSCAECGGTGRVDSLRLQVPAATLFGHRLSVPGAGEPGLHGGARGDLLVTCQVEPDPEFWIENGSLVTSVTVQRGQALAGTKATIRSLTGQMVSVVIPPGSTHGQRMRLEGLGLASGRGPAGLLLEVRVRPDVASPHPVPATGSTPDHVPVSRPAVAEPPRAGTPAAEAPAPAQPQDGTTPSWPGIIRRVAGMAGMALTALVVLAVVGKLADGDSAAETVANVENGSSSSSADVDSLLARIRREDRLEMSDFQALGARELDALDMALSPLRGALIAAHSQQLLRIVALQRRVPLSAWRSSGDTMSTAEAEVIADGFALSPVGSRERLNWYSAEIVGSASKAQLGFFANVLLASAGIAVDDAFIQRYAKNRLWYQRPTQRTLVDPGELTVHRCLRWHWQRGDEVFVFPSSDSTVVLSLDGRVRFADDLVSSDRVPLAGTILDPANLTDCRVPDGASLYFEWSKLEDAVTALADQTDDRMLGSALLIVIPLREGPARLQVARFEGTTPLTLQRIDTVGTEAWADFGVDVSDDLAMGGGAPDVSSTAEQMKRESPAAVDTTRPVSTIRDPLLVPTEASVLAAWEATSTYLDLMRGNPPDWAPSVAKRVSAASGPIVIDRDGNFVIALTLRYSAGASNALLQSAEYSVVGRARSSRDRVVLESVKVVPR